MWSVFIIWVVVTVLIVVLVVVATHCTKSRNILIDCRGRYSLTRFQVVVWTVVILSLVCGIAGGRLIVGQADVLGFQIPGQVLGLLGISVGSTVLSSTVKISKNATRPGHVAAHPLKSSEGAPSFWQMLLVEEGAAADKTVDVTKFQNFIITVVLVIAYVALSVAKIYAQKSAATIDSLPSFSSTFLVLLGISHAAYIGGKIPSPTGTPVYTVAERDKASATRNPNAAKAV